MRWREERDVSMQVIEISLSDIKGSAFDMRSETRDGDPDLLESIQAHGLMQPILLRPKGKGYEIVAGVRRYNAFKTLGKKTIPAIVQELDDRTAFEISLTENIQRRNMEPIEEARAFRDYLDKYKWGSITELATRINRRPSYVVDRLKIVELPTEVQRYVAREKISPSHAEELSRLETPEEKVELAKAVVDEELTTDQTSEAVGLIKEKAIPVKQAVQTVLILDRAREAASRVTEALKLAIIESSAQVKEIESSEARRLMENYMFLGTIIEGLKEGKIFCLDHRDEDMLVWQGCNTPISETHRQLEKKLGGNRGA
jgi:ParB family chromosome partitioning protein